MKACPVSVIRYRLQDVFIVPEDDALPPLKWDRQTQRFSLIPQSATITADKTGGTTRHSQTEDISGNGNSGDHKRNALVEESELVGINGTTAAATPDDMGWTQVKRLLVSRKGRSYVTEDEPLSPSRDAGGYVATPTDEYKERRMKPSSLSSSPPTNGTQEHNDDDDVNETHNTATTTENNNNNNNNNSTFEEGESDTDENEQNKELDLEIWKCAALYGVLAIGSSCHVLLYASEVTSVARLPPKEHVVYAVKKFDYLQLPPSCPSSHTPVGGCHAEDAMKDESIVNPQPQSRSRISRMKSRQSGVNGASGGKDAHYNSRALSEIAITEYLEVVQRFCNRCDHTGSAYFYFSYTANLALDGKDIIAASKSNQRRNGPPTPSALRKTPSLGSGGGGGGPAVTVDNGLDRQPPHTSETPAEYGLPCRFTHNKYAFQWNYPLTAAFLFQEESAVAVLTAAVPEFASSLSTHAGGTIPAFGSDVSLSHVSSSATAPPPVLADQLSMRSSSTLTQQGYHGVNAVGALLSMYVPSFIRGVVVQTDFPRTKDMPTDQGAETGAYSGRVNGALVTRLCRHWAGTRYNRRGLDVIGKTGWSANSAVTALWVWSDSPGMTTNPSSPVGSTEYKCPSPGPFSRVAVYTLIRGSVPCFWAQPADLTFKPPIRIAESDSNGGEELLSHIHALRCLLPYMEGLHCIDTTSLSKLEHPLSEAFATAVESLNEDEELRQQLPSEFELHYTKYNVKKKMKKYSLFTDMSDDLLILLGLASEGEDSPRTPTSGDELSLVPSSARLSPQSYALFDQWEFSNALEKDDECPSGTRSGTTAAVRASKDSFLGGSSNAGVGSPVNDCNTSRPLPNIGFGKFRSVQRAFFRINCLDCLDRTNLTQSIIALNVLPQMIQYVTSSESIEAAASPTTAEESKEVSTTGEREETDGKTEDEESRTTTRTPPTNSRRAAFGLRSIRRSSFLDAADVSCRRLWAANGIALSHLYAGSEAHFISYLITGKKGKIDKFGEGMIAMRRWYQQNFYDGDKQDVVTLMTRQHDPEPAHATTESPFARRLSGLNKMVVFGAVVATLSNIFNALLMVCVPAYRLRHDLVLVGFFWCVYMFIIGSYIMKDGQSYTNYPLLK